MFITFEGIEGSGKSTQARYLVERLKSNGISTILTREPGGTRAGRLIRQILLSSKSSDLSPLAELFLYVADRSQHVVEIIKPGLSRGEWVVCDRFFDATIAYQGYARGQDISLIRILNERATFGIRPDITFLLDLPAETGLERALKRNKDKGLESEARFESEAIDFHEAVRKGYLSIAAEDAKRVVTIDGTCSEAEIGMRIFEHIRPFIG